MRIPIAKESRSFVLTGLGFSLSLLYLGNRTLRKIAMATFGVSAALGWALRDPDRTIIPISNGILSPADGKVIRIETGKDVRRISIFVSPGNCHIIRSPADGSFEISETLSIHGDIPTTIAHATDDAHRLFSTAQGDVRQGDRIASIQFNSIAGPLCGSRIDVTFPIDQRLMVNVGDAVIAGVTAIAQRAADH